MDLRSFRFCAALVAYSTMLSLNTVSPPFQVYAQEMPPTLSVPEKNLMDKPIADTLLLDDEDDLYAGQFKPMSGIAGVLGLTNAGVYLSVNYTRQFTPDIMGFASLGFSPGRDENEIETFNPFTGQVSVTDQFQRPKKNDLMILPFTAGVQLRLFRRDIVSTFRPFVEIGAGPTLGYATDYLSGFFGGFGKGYATLGANGMVGIGSYFGSDPRQLQGLVVRYQFNAFPVGVEILEGTRRNFFGSIALTLVFGTFF